MIEITEIDDNTFDVSVKVRSTTTHRVTVTDDYYQKLTGGKVDRKTLIEESFNFLLQREPNTSILSRFDLPTIARYFPEYEKKIQATFA